jgi:hypothetical protein
MAWEENFIREGRTIREWLPELLGPEPATRRRAENAVSAMYWGAPVADKTVHEHRSIDFQTHQKIWGEKVSAIFADPEFAALEFLRSAVSRMKADADLTSRRSELEEQVLFPELEEPELIEPLDPETKAALMEELKQLHNEERLGRLANSLGPHMLHVVVEHAGSALLRDPQIVRAALRDPACCRAFAKALEKIGMGAVAFAPDLLSRDQPSASELGIPFPEALAAVARHDAATIAELVNRIGSNAPREAYSAADTLSAILHRCGPSPTNGRGRVAAADGSAGEPE